jgi:signal transduction histidine kinase
MGSRGGSGGRAGGRVRGPQWRRWLEASGEITTAVLAGAAPEVVLPRIATRIRELAGADCTMIAVPDPAAPAERLVVTVADGPDAASFRGLRAPIGGSVAGSIAAAVYRTGVARPVADVSGEPDLRALFAAAPAYGPALVAPLGGPAGLGLLIAANAAGGTGFSTDQAAVTTALAGQAGLAIRLAEAREARRQLAVYADRDRAAGELHDHVIQRLFAVGMALESANRQAAPPVQAKLHRAVDDLDHTIREVRATILHLQANPVDAVGGLRRRIAVVVDEVTAAVGVEPDVRVCGPVDTAVPAEVAEHALVVIRQALSEAVRHARATAVSVAVSATDEVLLLDVADNGAGDPAGSGAGDRRGALANLAARADALGGAMSVDRATAGGTRLVWSVPLRRRPGPC